VLKAKSKAPAIFMSAGQKGAFMQSAKLTLPELEEIALYTIQKINSYPKHFGKTVENYFDLLFPCEVKSYLFRRDINEKSLAARKGTVI
jgi:hypothetical protein